LNKYLKMNQINNCYKNWLIRDIFLKICALSKIIINTHYTIIYIYVSAIQSKDDNKNENNLINTVLAGNA